MKSFVSSFGIFICICTSYLFLFTTNSCKKDENDLIPKEYPIKNYSPDVHFEITGRMMEGKYITSLEMDDKGNTWIASGKDLYHYKNETLKESYTIDFQIIELSIAGDESLWIGTKDGGLGHLSERKFTWFTKANSNLPRDYISNVLVGLDGRVWFSSCQANAGGLMVYDGKEFKLFNPDNSILNQYVIDDICIDQEGAIYVVTQTYVTKSSVFRYLNNEWECLGNKNGTFYWVNGFNVGPSGTMYLIEDFTLSSASGNINKVYTYSDSGWKILNTDFIDQKKLCVYTAKADMRNYCWLTSRVVSKTGYFLYVFNGEKWISSPEGILPEDEIRVIKVDYDNNIWIGTAHNGIFVLKQ